MLDLCLLVIGQDQAECDEFDRSYVDCELRVVVNSEDRSIAMVANEHLALQARAVFGLIHPDVYLGPEALDSFYRTALEGKVCGIVGRNLGGTYRWCHTNPGLVSTLDDCSVFFRADSGLTFDEKTCDSFYAYVPDLCLQAQKFGTLIMVPEADAKHAGKRFRSQYQARQVGWNLYLDRLKSKWKGVAFCTT